MYDDRTENNTRGRALDGFQREICGGGADQHVADHHCGEAYCMPKCTASGAVEGNWLVLAGRCAAARVTATKHEKKTGQNTTMTKQSSRLNGVSRRRILQATAASAGMLGIGVGTVSADDARADGNALVLPDAHREGLPFNIEFVTAFEKLISCNENAPAVEVDCYDIVYDDGEEFALAFETAASAEIDTAVQYQLGGLICATGQGPWHVTSFRKA